ncbi:hypothetical protein BCR33DRAFT_755844 [Rhizoclosmatium globosum]|uniref:ABC transporter domain-containing protein n=1 Tax=Rhizoclosmatium globosum TaxID=329046 RepID=A0A1Y2APL5_9FUNG|nr:hypothetical protein BCR33DRAFT_755844 [Rhizoclosmatium globosum]|eukprot:ORY24436.1 hypothetical protein BCR33DRAFT_755844 [Rhizoclosmatium globosum]
MSSPGNEPRKPNQLKALSRKTISFQQRQMFTNICCICLCPLMMVIISAGLGTLINSLIAKSFVAEDILYCGNNASLTATGWPVFNYSDPRIYGANTPNGKSVNYMSFVNLNDIDGPPGAVLLNANKPCVYWFGDEYPSNSPIYEKYGNLTGAAKVDSTFVPPPQGGWIAQLTKLATDPQNFDFESFQYFTRFQQASWAVVGARPGLENALGALPNAGPLSLNQGLALTANASSFLAPHYQSSSGILGSIAQRLFINFTVTNNNKFPSISTTDDIDNILSNNLNNIITGLAGLNKSVLLLNKDKQTIAALQAFQLSADAITAQMPYGGIFLDAFDADAKAAKLTIARATVTQGIRAFPNIQNTGFSYPFGGLIGRILYPFGVSFLLPIFVIMLVKEKEDRIYIMMKMNGVKAWAYYVSHYTSPAVLIVLFFLWGNVQIVLAFVIATLFSNTSPEHLAPFAFYRGLSLMNTAAFTPGALPFGTEQFSSGTEFRSICVFLFGEIFVYGGLALYLNQVIPSEFGIVRPWHFPVTDLFAKAKSSQRKKANGEERARVDAGKYSDTAPIVMSHMKKVYPSRKGLGPKVGVRNVTFAEEAGVIFGLLGPNGAGKTTLISILTGLYESSGGVARLAGYDIKTQTSLVYNSIGCLSSIRHLVGRFDWCCRWQREGSRFPGSLEKPIEQETLGGEKRRLSIAIALVGNPSVVFLDEPTTGLDPEVRRLIWNIIQDARDNKTIILTTHSMEEAEALWISSLYCNPLRLKELYGTGFKLNFYSQAEDTARACTFVESILPTGFKKIDAFSTNTAYEFPAASNAIPILFEKIEKEKEKHGILQWGISQTTLEEVFLRIISDDSEIPLKDH